MKKPILLSMGILCFFKLVSAQTAIDDAVQGTGLNQHNYVGAGWTHGTSPAFYNGTLSYSNVTGAYVTLTFAGNKVEWYTEKKSTHGIAAVSIDGGAETMIDLYSSTEQHILVYTSPTLTQGNHTFKIRVTGAKNTASSGFYVIHDYLGTYQASTQPNSTNTFVGDGSISTWSPPANQNSAFGYNALQSVIQSSGNTAIGANALQIVGKTNGNTAVGIYALSKALGGPGTDNNTAVGSYALNAAQVFSGNTAIGSSSGPVEGTFLIYNTTSIGAGAKTTSFNQVRIGNTSVTSIGGQVSWSTLSDGRFKRDLREDVSGLEFVNKLRPVSYTVDKTAVQKFLGAPNSEAKSSFEAKEKPIRQTGFVAQEVEALVKKSGYVFSGVDLPKNDKDPYTIRYAEFVVPLVKAVQELSAKNEEQQKQNEEQQKQIDQLLTQLSKTEKGIRELQSSEISLLQNNPNPFSKDTEIKMVLPETATNAKIIVYNLEGKQLKELQVKGRGKASVNILGNELSAGMYIYALIVDGKVVDTKRMILTK